MLQEAHATPAMQPHCREERDCGMTASCGSGQRASQPYILGVQLAQVPYCHDMLKSRKSLLARLCLLAFLLRCNAPMHGLSSRLMC